MGGHFWYGKNDYIMWKWILLLVLLVGCVNEEEQGAKAVEQWIYDNVKYTDQVNCQHRAVIGIAMLEAIGYEAYWKGSNCPNGESHIYVHWEKNDKEGDILNCDGATDI